MRTQELSALRPGDPQDCLRTAVDRATIERVIEGITAFPADFHLHPEARRVHSEAACGAARGLIDWALAETLAFGSLVLEGTPVRLSGEEAAAGRSASGTPNITIAEDGRMYVPLQHLAPARRVLRFTTVR